MKKRTHFKKRNKVDPVEVQVEMLRQNVLNQREEENRKKKWLESNPINKKAIVLFSSFFGNGY
jgi:chorismate-pyruvate lyase